MGRADPGEAREAHKRYSMIIVPFETPGLTIVRDVSIMNHHSPEGHCEIDFDVRVPAANLLGEEGDGFTIAQARLGPGRIHHCMRTIGQCELALEMMVSRAKSRIAFGSALAEYANIQDWIAKSRIEIDQARLLVLRAAWLMDKAGNKAARVDVSAIKVVAGRLQTRVLDRANSGVRRGWPHRGYAARLSLDLGTRAPLHRRPRRSPSANRRSRRTEEVGPISLGRVLK